MGPLYNDIFISNLRGRANSGVQVNLSTDAIKNSKLLIAGKEINKKFNELMDPIFGKLKVNDLEIQTLSRFRDTLLPKLMNSEIRF